MDTPETSHTALKADLIGLGDLKVWSVLVTIFGDLAPLKEDSIPGPVLSALTGQMGIKPEALRVALHRLKKDGWIETTKSGRVSHYALSAYGRTETKAARPRIFGPFPETTEDWFLIIQKDASMDQKPAHWLPLGRGQFLTQTQPSPQTGTITSKLIDATLPDWALTEIFPSDLSDAYGRLENILSKYPLSKPPTKALDALTLRVLILHAWRRLVLRHTPAAPDLMGRNWRGSKCRSLVLKGLETLPRHDLSTLIL